MLKHFGGGTGGETGLSRRKDEQRSFDTSHLARDAVPREREAAKERAARRPVAALSSAPMFRSAFTTLFSIILLLGCSARPVGSVHDAGVDAQVAHDAGVDAQAAPDAGTDAATPDAGPPDAGPPPCACPAFPDSCSAPAVNEPAFTPNADALVGQLFDVIACATDTLHIAMYEASWPCLADGLRTALERNPSLTVQVVADDDNCAVGTCFFDDLMDTGRVEITRDSRSAYMHEKWVIADGARIWVGSANFAERSMCVDHNNSLVVEEPDIVARYEEVFGNHFGGGFGPTDQAPVSAGAYTVYFSPQSPTSGSAHWQDDILAAIGAATTRIDVMMSAWTLTEMADALIAAQGRGVAVRILVSSIYASGAPAQAALAGGIDVRQGNVHDKLIVVDDSVFTGSANWSVHARSNDEDVLRIDDAAVATAYGAEMDRVYADATAVTAP